MATADAPPSHYPRSSQRAASVRTMGKLAPLVRWAGAEVLKHVAAGVDADQNSHRRHHYDQRRAAVTDHRQWNADYRQHSARHPDVDRDLPEDDRAQAHGQ